MWQQKKESGETLSKEEREERATWTEDQWTKYNCEQQCAENREATKQTQITDKVTYGGTLTPEEEKYLEQNNPQALKKYKETKAEKKAYEEKLKNCKTKDEVDRLKTETLGQYAASLKKVVNDPYIPLSAKLEKAQEMLGKTRNIQDAEEEFKQSAQYQNLPTEAEELAEQTEEATTKQEQNLESAQASDSDAQEPTKDGDSVEPELTAEDADESVTADTDQPQEDYAQTIEDTFTQLKISMT